MTNWAYLRDVIVAVVAFAVVGNIVGAIWRLVRTRKGKS